MSLPTLESLESLESLDGAAPAPDSAAPPGGTASLRPYLTPVPALEPPYDDDAEPARRPHLRLVIDAAPTLPFEESAADLAEAVDFGALPTPRSALPDPARWSGQLVQAVYEVLAGRRPLQQLMPWTDERVYLTITGRLRRQRLSGAVRLTSVHVSEPRDGVAEACAVIRNGLRSHAVALRLEGTDGRWRCTALQLG